MAGEESKKVKYYSLKELEEHNNHDSVWVSIHNKVYDLTAFLDEHPGGEEVLLEQAGKLGTEAFEDVGHSSDARDMMNDYLIGELRKEDREGEYQTGKSPDVAATGERSWSSWLLPVIIAFGVAMFYRYYIQHN